MPSATASNLPLSPAELSYLHTSLSSTPPIRPDGRTPTDFRTLQAETGILPATNGSAHVSFSDGSEAIVGVKLEVEKASGAQQRTRAGGGGGDEMEIDGAQAQSLKGSADWITFTLTLPGLRDDDSQLVYLEELLREPLLLPTHTTPSLSTSHSPSLPDRLDINTRYHWHIYIDVVLISPHALSSYPLPLLSMSTHLALRDTRVPRLKSEGEEDPVADDDWMASTYLYPRAPQAENSANPATTAPAEDIRINTTTPPVTLLIITVADNILFDPSHSELKISDSILAISITKSSGKINLLGVRTLDTPARDTMKGVPRLSNPTTIPMTSSTTAPGLGVDGTGAAAGEADLRRGVWNPRLGGVKRSVLKGAVKSVVSGGVADDVLRGLDAFVIAEGGL